MKAKFVIVTVGAAIVVPVLLLGTMGATPSKPVASAGSKPSGEELCKDSNTAPCAEKESMGFYFCPHTVKHIQVPESQLDSFEELVSRIWSTDWPEPTQPGWERPFDRPHNCPRKPVKACLKELRVLAQSFQPPQMGGFLLHEPVDDILLSRLLVASDMDVKAAAKLLETYCSFRSQLGGAVKPHQSWTKHAFMLLPFKDQSGRPVILARAKYFDTSFGVDFFRQILRGMIDVACASMLVNRSSEVSVTNPLEQYIFVLDVRGATANNCNWTGIQTCLFESAYHYPDRVAQLYLLGVNTFVRAWWQTVAALAHPRSRQKVRLITSSEINDYMCKLVDPALLPPEYGGFGPNLPCATKARNLQEHVGRLAVQTWQALGVCEATPEDDEDIAVRHSGQGDGSLGIWTKTSKVAGPVVRSMSKCRIFLETHQAFACEKQSERSLFSINLLSYLVPCVGWRGLDSPVEPITAQLEGCLKAALAEGGDARQEALEFMGGTHLPKRG